MELHVFSHNYHHLNLSLTPTPLPQLPPSQSESHSLSSLNHTTTTRHHLNLNLTTSTIFRRKKERRSQGTTETLIKLVRYMVKIRPGKLWRDMIRNFKNSKFSSWMNNKLLSSVARVEFSAAAYSCMENEGTIKLGVVRVGNLDCVSTVKWVHMRFIPELPMNLHFNY